MLWYFLEWSINSAYKPDEFICSIRIWTSYLPMLRLQMNQPWECGLINPKNYLTFSKTTLSQLGVFNN